MEIPTPPPIGADNESNASGVSYWNRTGTDVFLVNSGDDVGIGTDSPNAPLEVAGVKPGVVGGFQGGMLQVKGDVADEFYNSVITGHNSFNTNTQLWYLGSTSGLNNDIAFINRKDGVLFFSTNNAKKMTILSGGNVGIGTTAPDEKLTVNGNASFGTGADLVKINDTGHITLEGDARVQREIQLNIRNAVRGASAPVEALRAWGSAGGVLVPVDKFSKVTQQDVYGEFHYKFDMDDSVDVEFHVMWLPGVGWTSGNYTWCLEYIVKDEKGEDYNDGTPTTICHGGTPVNATQEIETEFLDTIDLNHGQVISAHFYRDVADDDGDDTGDVRYLEIRYTVNRLGEAI